jgi:hypothetical protein
MHNMAEICLKVIPFATSKLLMAGILSFHPAGLGNVVAVVN